MFFKATSACGSGGWASSRVTSTGFVCMSGCLLRFYHSYWALLASDPRVGFISNYRSASWSSVSLQALALPVCGASSRRPAPGPPASSTLMRLTPWARSAPPPCLASPTQRRSRPSTSFWWKWMVSTLLGCFCEGRRVFSSFRIVVF